MTKNPKYPAYGTSKKMRLISNNLRFGPQPDDDREIEQRLTILANGQVWLSRYRFGAGYPYTLQGIEYQNIGREAAQDILMALDAYFPKYYPPMLIADACNWVLHLTDEQGRTITFDGPLRAGIEVHEFVVQSEHIREALDLRDLFAFDGQARYDRVDFLQIDYHQFLNETAQTESSSQLNRNFRETKDQIIIDRSGGLLKYARGPNRADPLIMTIPLGKRLMDFLLDDLDNHFFERMTPGQKDKLVSAAEARRYMMLIDFQKAGIRMYAGDYDKDGLPYQWVKLMRRIQEVILMAGHGPLLDESVYLKSRRKTNDLMFLSVVFEEQGREYTYLCGDETVKIGDRVLVPVKDGKQSAMVDVVNVRWLPKESAPYPLHKIKTILRKESAADVLAEPSRQASPLDIAFNPLDFPAEPLQHVEPDDVRAMLLTDAEEPVLASALAQVINKTYWLKVTNRSLMDDRSRRIRHLMLDEWLVLEAELYARAFTLLIQEDRASRAGFCREKLLSCQAAELVLKRNGYIKSDAWWARHGAHDNEINFFNVRGWRIIRDQAGIDRLFSEFCFAKSTVKEMRYDSGASMSRHGGAGFLNLKRELRMVLQSEAQACYAIEMVFEDLDQLNLQPRLPPITSKLSGAHMVMEGDSFVWFDNHDYEVTYKEMYRKAQHSWVRAGKVKWRVAIEYAGKQDAYVNRPKDG